MRARLLACLLAVSVVALVSRSHAAPPASSAGARERSRAAFRAGVTQLRAEDWRGARASFEEAYRLYPHPSILLNLGVARLRTGEPVLAEQDLLRFLSEDAGASPEEVAGAREALAEARSRIGTVRVTVSPSEARVTLDGAPIERTARVVAGAHVLEAVAEGYVPQRREIEVPAKRETEVTLTMAPVVRQGEDPRGTPVRAIAGWSAAGLAGVALVTSGLAALRASSLADDYADRGSPRFQDPDTRSEGIAFRTTADVALGVAILSATAAVVLLLTDVGRPGAIARSQSGAVLRW